MPIEQLRRALQVRQPSPAPLLPASVAIGLAVPAATLGIVLIGMDLHLFGLLAWTVAIAMIAFVLEVRYAIGVVALLAGSGMLLWRFLLGEAALLSGIEQMAVVWVTLLAGVVGRLFARELRQRDAIAADKFHLDVFANTIESIFEASQDCIKLLAADGEILSISNRGLQLIGADSISQLVGQNWFSFWGAEQQKALAAAWQSALENGNSEFEGACRTLTGERRIWRNTFTRVRTPEQGKTYIICISQDLTDSVTLQQTLKTGAAQLRGLLSSIDDASFALDANWTITAANQRAEQLHLQMGYTVGALGRSFWEVFPLHPGEPAAIVIRRAMDQQVTQFCEYFYAPKQLWFGITAFPYPNGIGVLARDITLLKSAQKRAIEESTRLKVAEDIADFGDWAFDYGLGSVQFSPRAVQLLELQGCAESDYKKCLLEKLDARDRMTLVQAIINSSAKSPKIDVKVRLPLADGSTRHLHWVGRLIADEHGNAERMFGAVQEVGADAAVSNVMDMSRGLVRELVDTLPQQVLVIDRDGRYIVTNRTWERSRREYYGDAPIAENFFDSHARQQRDDSALAEMAHSAARDILSGALTYFEHEYELLVGGASRHFLMQALPFRKDGETMVMFIHSDITSVKQMLVSVLEKDDLTNLPNRRALMTKLAEFAAQDHPFALLLLNLDRFKNINDTLGHGCGDELLQQAARRLRAALPDTVFLARTGGDEFAMICSDTQHPSIIDATLACFVDAFALAGESTFVTASLGIAMCPVDSSDAGELMKFASAALQRAKAAGRNNCQRFKDTMLLPSRERLALENELHTALQRREFELFYQGKFDLETGELVGAEALLRWRSQKRGLVSPADFIPLLEETGLILPVGEWILADACHQVRRWFERSGLWLPVAVNVSVLQIASRTFAEKAIAILRNSSLPPNTIELEITESALMADTSYGAQLIQTLKAAGFSIALDDFGTGYSSLGYLRKFMPSTLKIDRSFIADLTTEADDREIVGGIVQLAKALNIEVVAEGIELVEQRNILCELGCRVGQGYLFGRPLPAAQFERGVMAVACGVNSAMALQVKTAT